MVNIFVNILLIFFMVTIVVTILLIQMDSYYSRDYPVNINGYLL